MGSSRSSPIRVGVTYQRISRLPARAAQQKTGERSEEHTSELQSQSNLVCRLLLEKKNSIRQQISHVLDSTTHRLLVSWTVLLLTGLLPNLWHRVTRPIKISPYSDGKIASISDCST